MATKTPFIDQNSASDAYEEALKWYRSYFDPIEEFDRIARNRPSLKIAEGLPKTTDGTTAAIIQEAPKRVVQQVPTGLVECQKYPEYAKIADIELRDKIIPNSKVNGSYLQKTWVMTGRALTHGKSTSYTFFTENNGVMYAEWVIPYVKDVLGEKGKAYAPDSKVRFMRSWYQKRDLQAIIDREKMLQDRKKDYKSDWDLKRLAEFIEGGASAKPADLQTPAEREKGDGYSGGYEVIHCFQEGKGASFYSFAPRFNNGKPIRVKTNPDPRGYIPLDDLYCNIDLSNPLGRGIVELSGGIQNLMDQQLQMFQYMTTLMSAPPIQVWGGVKTSYKLKPNAIWDMGNNQNNRIEPYQPIKENVTNFVNNFQFLQSKIYNMNNSQDTSVSGQNGNVNQSKTQAGVEAQQQRLGISDNYLRKQVEEWFQAQCETALNIHFAEMTGKQEISLKPADVKEIMKTPAAKFMQGTSLTIPYKDIQKVAFHFQVNPSSSEVKENTQNLERLTQVYELIMKDPDPQMQDKKQKVLKVLINEIGAEGTDDIFPEEQTDEQGNPVQEQPQQPQMTPEMVQQMIQEGVGQAMEQMKQDKPQEAPELQLIKALGVKFDKLPEEARNAILEQLDLPSQGDDPIAFDQSMNAFNALGTAESQMTSAEQAEKQAQQQQTQAQGQTQSDATSQQDDMGGPLTPEEQQIVEEMLNRGMTEDDAEQAITMLRAGRDPQEIMQVIGAKVNV